jgi:peptidoglycan/xylan/chitin deacetylase (PgdA/CDA1 family)
MIVCAGIGYVLYRLFVHAGHLHPAIVTTRMSVTNAISESIPARVRRLVREKAGYGDRSTRPKLIALTFDDGPYPIFTPLLIERLRELHVPGTFFLIGRDAQQWPGLAQRIRAAGDEVGDHTYSHPDLDKESAARVRREIIEGRNVLFRITGDPSVRRLFRPPHGRYTERTLEVAQSLGYETILWTDDGGDWRTVTPGALAQHLEEHATAPEIVLLHNGKLPTIAMLGRVVARFKAAGYRFVTVDGLLRRVTAQELNHPAKHPV